MRLVTGNNDRSPAWTERLFDGLPEPLRTKCVEAFRYGRKETMQRLRIAKEEQEAAK